MLKKITFISCVALVLLQFVRPERNQGDLNAQATDIAKVMPMPTEMHQNLITACYDCHSNHTEYPWYANINPVGLWINHHVKEGKQELNFSEFGTYSPKKQDHKLEEIAEALRDGWMPLESYTMMHKNAILTPAQKTEINNWISAQRKNIKL